jgi:hypothetical protein
MQAMERQGIYNIHIQLKRYIFDPRFSIIDLYRIILLPANYKNWGEKGSDKIDLELSHAKRLDAEKALK